MLIIVSAVTVGPWLALWMVLAVRAAISARAGYGPPERGGPEPPAVVSLLAGRLDALGYRATLLDLAARGWFWLDGQGGGPVMCVLGETPPDAELTGYERLAYGHVVTRAGGRRDVPAAALSDGFAADAASGGASGTSGTVRISGTGGGAVADAKDIFMAAFREEVIADSRQRGLTRPRLSEPAGCLLWVAAFVPAVACGLALHAHRSHAYWIPVAGFLALCVVTSIAVKGEKLTPAGRAALRGWRDRCPGPVATTFAPGQRPGREVAYAAALGRATPAVELFSGTPGQPRGKAIWSGYGGSWRQITLGDPQPRGVLNVGSVMLSIVAVVLVALLPATIVTAVVAHGELRAAAFGVLACDVAIALWLGAKDASVPAFAEFDGQVVEAWLEEESGENSASTYPCLAIDDGVRDRAWVFAVTAEQYRRFAPGMLVHARVNPRRNRLLDISPLIETVDR
jgi:hypothetical protein